MKKGGIASDISETLLELGKSTATQTVKAVGQTFNPLNVLEKNNTGVRSTSEKEQSGKMKGETPNSTNLDLNKLKRTYDAQDSQDLQMTRQRLFKLVKEGEQKAIEERKQEEEERKRKELKEQEAEKKKKEQAQQQQTGDMPKGKEKRSIFAAHKKKADLSHAETKPSVSKG